MKIIIVAGEYRDACRTRIQRGIDGEKEWSVRLNDIEGHPGGHNDYFEVPHSTSLSLTTDFTLMAW